jgi:DNA polymerase III delta prime subunit
MDALKAQLELYREFHDKWTHLQDLLNDLRQREVNTLDQHYMATLAQRLTEQHERIVKSEKMQ